MSAIAQSLKSIAKTILLSRHTRGLRAKRGGSLIIMGNGPSLRDTIDRHGELLQRSATMAVNFAALAPDFFEIKPQSYVLMDPHFFEGENTGNLELLRKAFKEVRWPMTLFVPASRRKLAQRVYGNEYVKIATFNAVGAEGHTALTHALYGMRLGMPRPRNVLIPSIMIGIWQGYSRIIITGADHSWMQTLSVTDENEVVSIQPHFYADSATELQRIRHDYRGRKLHDIVESFAVAFRAYHQIRAFADKKGVEILNATPGSFIDAFERTSL